MKTNMMKLLDIGSSPLNPFATRLLPFGKTSQFNSSAIPLS